MMTDRIWQPPGKSDIDPEKHRVVSMGNREAAGSVCTLGRAFKGDHSWSSIKLISSAELEKYLQFADLTRDVMIVKIQARVSRGQGLGGGDQLSFNADVTVNLVIATVIALKWRRKLYQQEKNACFLLYGPFVVPGDWMRLQALRLLVPLREPPYPGAEAVETTWAGKLVCLVLHKTWWDHHGVCL